MDAFSPLWVILLATLPVFEARYAIPFAILLGFSPRYAFLLGIVGNLLPVIPLFLTRELVSDWLRARFSQTKSFFSCFFTPTMRNQDLSEPWGGTCPLPVRGCSTTDDGKLE